MKTIIFSLLINCLCISVGYASIIKGVVSDKNTGEVIVGAVISVPNDSKGTITNENGEFEFEVKESDKIHISFLGYKTQVVKFTGHHLHIELEADNQELESIEVVGRFSKQYNSEYTYSASKIPAKNTELSQSVSTVTKELIMDRQAFRLGEVVKNISGVSTVSFYNHYSIRGVTQFAGNRESRYINGMRTSQIYFNQPLSTNIERVEVVKGPSSMTFANTDAGGTMNMVTKKPLRVDQKQVSLTVGSFNTTRAALDFTGPLNKDKTLLYRFNVGYENSLSYRDLMYKKAYQIAPTLTYLPNDKTRVNIELVLSNDQSRVDRGQPIFLADDEEEADLSSTPMSLAIGAPNDYYKVKDQLVIFNLSHAFTNNIKFNASYMSQAWDEDLSEYRCRFIHAVDINGNGVPNLLNMHMYQRKQKWYTTNYNMFLNQKLAIGRLKMQNVIGVDCIKFKNTTGSGTLDARGYRSADGTESISSFDPSQPELYSYTDYNGTLVPTPNVPYFDIQNPSYNILDINEFIAAKYEYPRSAYQTVGAYFMSRSELGRFILDFGLRQEWYTDYENYEQSNENKIEQEALLPKVGLTFKAHKNVNLYGVYTECYQPQSTSVLDSPNSGGPFDPLKSNMYEVGVKTSWYNDLLHANLALFSIEQKNILVSAQDPDNTELLRQRGVETSEGVEFELIGKVSSNLSMNIAYAYIDARISEDLDELVGLRKENTPEHNFSLWARYNFSCAALKDFGIGIGCNYVDEKIPWYTRDFTIPSYCVFDGALYYKLKNMKIALNVKNIADIDYWYGAIGYTSLYPAAPRNAMVNVTYNF